MINDTDKSHCLDHYNVVTGVPTGFVDLDEKTSGMQKGDLIIVAGRPSMGKSALALNIAGHVAIDLKLPVIIFTMEMPSKHLVMRLLGSQYRIDQHQLRTGKLKPEDMQRMTDAMAMLGKVPLHINETPALNSNKVRTECHRLYHQYGGLGLVVVDYLQLMTCTSKERNLATEISQISRSLKALAKELEVPVIALSQLNRSLEQRSNKRPVMSDLRESGAIEQDADVILAIYRDEVYNEDSKDRGVAEIILLKQRNGPIGTVRLTFLDNYTSFENLAAL
jgi:replicative DNA helicase